MEASALQDRGDIHILIFAGFILLAMRAFTVLIVGVSPNFVMPGLSGEPGTYTKSPPTTPPRWYSSAWYSPSFAAWCSSPRDMKCRQSFGKAHKADAIFLLALIAILMVADSLFEAAKAAGQAQQGMLNLAALSLPWMLKGSLVSVSLPTLGGLYFGAYLVHELAFYFLLCYRPFGIQFHVETSLFNVYFAKLDRGTLKPVRWGVSDEHLDQVKSFGVKTFEDFTWKHMLDFYSCADCGRCSDNCPANAVGRPLSPRFITIKARDYAFQHYPMFGTLTMAHPVGTP